VLYKSNQKNIRVGLFAAVLIGAVTASVGQAGVDVTRGHFRVVFDDMGRGNIFYDNQPMFDQIQPIPYMRNADYSTIGVPDETQRIEKKESEDESLITLCGGNPAWVTNEIQITLTENVVVLEKTYTTGDAIKQVGVGCRYYLNKNLFFDRDVEYARTNGEKGIKRLDEKLTRKIFYGIGQLQVQMPGSELTFSMDDTNSWNLQNLQKTKKSKEEHYLLFYELPDWKPGEKRTWKEKLLIRERRIRKHLPYEYGPAGPVYETGRFPKYVKNWDDQKTDLLYGKRDAIYLNGWWKLVKLKETEKNPADDYGMRNGFFGEKVDDQAWESFFVPWDWNAKDSFRGVGWYRRTFSVPAGYQGQRLILEFGQVLSEASVWINGRQVGKHKMYFYSQGRRSCYGAFSFDISDYVKFGKENTLAVRVYHYPAGRMNGGIWQPVQISVYPKLFINKTLVNSDVEKGRVTVRCFFDNREEKERTVRLSATLAGWKSYRYHLADDLQPQTCDLGDIVVPKGVSEKTFDIPIKSPVCWTYEKPVLYHLTFNADRQRIGQTRFGFRQITIKGVHFYLNGKKLWIPADELEPPLSYVSFFSFNQEIDLATGAAFGGYSEKGIPNSPYALNLDEWFQRYQKMNLTLLRAHSDCWPEPMFDRADEVGMMVYPELGHPERYAMLPFDAGNQTVFEVYEKSGILPEGYKAQIKDQIYAHWNHPSIWAYSMGNEMYANRFSPFLCDMYDYLKRDVRIPFPLTQSGRYYSQRSDDPLSAKVDFFDDHYYSTVVESWTDNEERHSNLNTYIHGKLDRPWFNGECFGIHHNLNWYNYDVFYEPLRKYLPNIPRAEYVSMCNRTEEDIPENQRYAWGLARESLRLFGIRDYLMETQRGNPRRGEYYKRMAETHRRWNQYVTGFASHCIMPDLQEKPLTSFGQIMKQVNSPLYVCTDLYFRHHFLAGDEFTTQVYIFNDTLEDVSDIRIGIDIIDENAKAVYRGELKYSSLAQGEKKIQPFVWKIPSDLKTGRYTFKLGMFHRGRKVVENEYGTYILGPDRRRATIKSGEKSIALYLKRNQPATKQLLDRFKVEYHPIHDFNTLDQYRILIIGANGLSPEMKSAGPLIRKWVEKGGKLLCFEQLEFLGPIPFAREYEITETKVLNVDLIVPQYPVFNGLENSEWDMWDGDMGIITQRHIQSLATSVLGTSAFHRQMGMTMAEVRIGKGIVFFSQAQASNRYGKDSVATRYLENVLHYTLETPWDGKQIPSYEIPVITGQEIGDYDIRPLDPGKAFFVDISKVANRGFRDEKGGDGVGGWFDEGEAQDLRRFPVGRQTFEGIPFKIIDPKINNGRSCIVLHTKGNKRYPKGDRPEQVTIPVNAKLKRMIFVVASAWTDDRTRGKTVAEIVVKFAGGECLYETETIPIKPGFNIADWFIRAGGVLRGAKLAWSTRDPRITVKIGVWMFEWENRQPQAEIQSITFKTGHLLAIPALIAVTGEKAEVSR
jgi:beta-galactosidase